MSIEATKAITPYEFTAITSGGVNADLPSNMTEIKDFLEVKSRSAQFSVDFADRIQAMRQYITKRYPDGDLSNPNIGIKRGSKRLGVWEYEDRDTYAWVTDAEGIYSPTPKDNVVILGQVLHSDDTVLEGTRWLAGHIYTPDMNGSMYPTGRFIENGIRGDETVVDFSLLVRPDGYWIPKETQSSVTISTEVFPGNQLAG